MPRSIRVRSNNIPYETEPQTCGQADAGRVANQARWRAREVRNLTVMGMDPKQPPDQTVLIKELEQSARAEKRLRSMALAHAKGKLRSHGRKRCKRCD